MNSPGVTRRKLFLFLGWSVCLVMPACSGLPQPLTYHDPLTAPEHRVLGETYVKQGDNEGATREFQAAIKRDPYYVPALIALGDLNFENGMWDDAESHYRKALELSPNNPVAANNLAMVYLTKGERLEETERLAKFALSQGSTLHPYIQETLATLYVTQGRWQEAQLAVDDAEATLRPEHSALQERLRDLRKEIASRQTPLRTLP